MSTLSEYVTENLKAAADASDLRSVQVVGWDKQPTEKWAVMWRPLGLDLQQSLDEQVSSYQIGIAIYGPSTDTEKFEKHTMTPSAQGSLIGEISSIGWLFGEWEFMNENPDDAGIKLAAATVAELPSIREFRDDGIDYVDTEIIFWDIDAGEPYTGSLTIDYKPTGTEGGFHRVDLIGGTGPLGVLNSGGYDIVISVAGDEPRLFTVEVDEDMEQVEHAGETYDLWKLKAIMKDDVLTRHTGDDAARTSGFIGVNIIPQFVAPSTFYRFANRTIAWEWRDQVPEGYAETTITFVDIDNEEEWAGGDTGSGDAVDFEVNANSSQEFIRGAGLGTEGFGFYASGGLGRHPEIIFDDYDHATFFLSVDEYDYLGDGSDGIWEVFFLGIRENISSGDVYTGNMTVRYPNWTAPDGTEYLDAERTIPWRLTVN